MSRGPSVHLTLLLPLAPTALQDGAHRYWKYLWVCIALNALLMFSIPSFASNYGWRHVQDAQILDESGGTYSTPQLACDDFVDMILASAHSTYDQASSSVIDEDSSFANPARCSVQYDVESTVASSTAVRRYVLSTKEFSCQILSGSGLALIFAEAVCQSEDLNYQGHTLQITGADVPCRNLHTCPVAGNPIALGQGNKRQAETDFVGVSIGARQQTQLQFSRYYNSEPSVRRGRFGRQWRHSFEVELVYSNVSGGLDWITISMGDGRQILFKEPQTGFDWIPQNGAIGELTDNFGSWEFTDTDRTLYEFDSSHRLTKITTRDGFETTLIYNLDGDADTLDEIEGHFGQKISLSYVLPTTGSFKLVSKVTLPDSEEIDFEYTAEDMLWKAIYPDEGAGTSTRTYLYGENSAPERALTSITDENGVVEFARWEYDDWGRANLSVRKNDAGKVEFTYNANGTVETDTFIDSGKVLTNTYHFSTYSGLRLATEVEGGPCPRCGPVAALSTYDSVGNLTSTTDDNGNRTLFAYGAERNETCRIEGIPGSGIDAAYRRVLTTWTTSRQIQFVRVYEPINPTMTAPTTCSTDQSDTSWGKRKETEFEYWEGKIKKRFDRSFDGAAGASAQEDETARTTEFAYHGQNTAASPSIFHGLLDTVTGPGPDQKITYSYETTTTNPDLRQGELKEIRRYSDITNYISTYITKRDGAGRPLRVADANENSLSSYTAFTYHPRGWVTNVVAAAGTADESETAIDYDDVGLVEKVTRDDGSYIEYEYDAAHRLTDTYDNLGNHVHYDLDFAGNVKGEETKDSAMSSRHSLQRVFSDENRYVQFVNGENDKTAYQYDDAGNLIVVIDPRDPNPIPTNTSPSIASTLELDALNRVINYEDPEGGDTVVEFDVLDNLISITDPNSIPTTYDRNGFGEVKVLKSYDAGYDPSVPAIVDIDYEYDDAGNRDSATDARGVVVGYQYDALDRLTEIDYPTDTDSEFFYDGDESISFSLCSGSQNGEGQLTGVVDESGHTKYRYDLRGNPLCKETYITGANHTRKIEYEWDTADRLKSVTYPSGMKVTYYRNVGASPDERIHKVTYTPSGGSETDLIVDIEYEPFGPVKFMETGSGIETTRAYDDAYRLTELDVVKPSVWTVMDWTFSFDPADNVDSLVDNLGDVDDFDYDYDDNSRLDWANWAPNDVDLDVKWRFTYDENGNRLSYYLRTPDDTEESAYTYFSGTNRIEAIDWSGNYSGSAQPDRDFEFDDAGNVTKIDRITDVIFTYADSGRVRSSSVTNIFFSQPYVYSYNALGQRIFREDQVDSDRDRVFYYDENGQIIAVEEANGWSFEYIYIDDMPVAFIRYADEGNGGGGTAALYYLHVGAGNVPEFTTDATGSSTPAGWRLPSDAFTYKHSGVDHKLAFPGQYREDDGTYYNYFRDYEPDTGRYLQSDPIGLNGGLNTYSYARANPVRYVDPFGLSDLYLYPSSNTLVVVPDAAIGGLPATFPASNRPRVPSADPFQPEGNGPLPTGTFPTSPLIETGLGPDTGLGSFFVPIQVPAKPPYLPRPGLGLHAGRENSPLGPGMAGTLGCARTTESAGDLLRNDPPQTITIVP